jgi:hypothetical protein
LAAGHGTGLGHRNLRRQPHRAGVEAGQLVVLQVGDDEALRGVAVLGRHQAAGVDAPALVVLQVGPEVVADHADRHRIAAHQLVVVGDVAGATAIFASHARRQEGQVDLVDLVRKDVVGELTFEHHDGVVGHRSGDGGAQAHGGGGGCSFEVAASIADAPPCSAAAAACGAECMRVRAAAFAVTPRCCMETEA